MSSLTPAFSSMILLAFSNKVSKLSGLSPIWYILITVLPSSLLDDFWLSPVKLPQAARVAPSARTLAEAKAYFFQFFMRKTPFLFFFINIMKSG